MQFSSFDEIARQHLVVIFINISLDIINLILIAMAEDVVLALRHDLTVTLLDVGRVEFEGLARLQIDKTVWAVLEVEVLFQLAVKDVEQDDLVLVVLQVFKGLEQLVGIVQVVQHVRKNHHQATLMGHLGNLMKALDGCRGFLLVLVVMINKFLQFGINQLVMHRRHLGWFMEGDGLVEKVKAHGIALAAHQFH